MRALCLICLTFFLGGCGYRFSRPEPIAISIPYAKNAYEGELNDALAQVISQTPYFRYTNGEGDWTLFTKVLKTTNDRIGYRYDRDPKSGELRDNIIGIENRKKIMVEIRVENSATGKLILGPQVIQAFADYDYVDSNSLQDLSFVDPAGKRRTSIAFSLGQLDSVGGAGEDAIYPIYQRLAQKIVDGLIASGENGR